MPKLSLERFREIRRQSVEIYDVMTKFNDGEIQLSEEDTRKIEAESAQMISDLHDNDLSDIPFEEYEGFYNLGFDFSGTGANIDFNIMFVPEDIPVRVKGCNIRNFDFDKYRYDEESFDEEFMSQHSERFIDSNLPQDVKDRYYVKRLEIDDVLRYGFYDGIESGRLSSGTVRFFEKVKPAVARFIEPDLFDFNEFKYDIIDGIENYEGELTEDVIKSIETEVINQVLSSGYLNLNDYKRIVNNPRIRALVSEDQLIDFGENDELASIYLRSNLSLEDIYENAELFRGKKFLTKLSEYKYTKESFEEITEEKIFYLLDNFPDLTNGIDSDERMLLSFIEIINIEAPIEENLKSLQNKAIEILNGINGKYLKPDIVNTLDKYYPLDVVQSRLSDYDRIRFDRIMKHTTQEKMENYGVHPRTLESSDILLFFSKYGLETVMEFDKANGNVFSKNNFELARKIFNYYMHYSAGYLSDRSLLYRSNEPEDYDAPYSLKDFEECVRRMIVFGPTDWDYSGMQPIDFRNFSQEFKEKYPRMFLSENAPQELQDKFYTKQISFEDLETHSEWISLLYGKDFELGIKTDISFKGTKDEHVPLFEGLKRFEKSKSAILNFIKDNEKILKILEIYQEKNRKGLKIAFETLNDLDDFKDALESKIESKILSGEFLYDDNTATDLFKTKHPDFFIDKDAPEALKNIFYSGRRKPSNNNNFKFTIDKKDLETLKNTPNWQEYLLGKNEDILKTISVEFIKQADIESVRDTFLFFLEKQPEIAMNMIQVMSANQILSTGIILSEEQIKQIIEENPGSTLKVLLFSNKIDKEKITQLSEYKELNNLNNTIDSVLSKTYLSKDEIDYDEVNHQIDEIYDLFTYDNVPEFLKTFKLFELGNFANASNPRIQSYKTLDTDSRNKVIMSDLFRISLDSNNRSLRKFAEIMKYGDEISKRVYQNNELDLSNLSNEEQVIFSQYIDTLVAIHNISKKSNNDKIHCNTNDSHMSYQKLLEQYMHDGKPLESTRVLTELFHGEIQGEVSPEMILQYMDKKHELSDERRKQNSKKISDGNLHLESGDFIKGIRGFDRYLRSMLEYGLKGGEFNREFSHSDATPLDLDFGYVSEANMQENAETDRKIISTTISKDYGKSWIVLKQYGKHFEEDQGDLPIKFSRTPEYWTNHLDDNSSSKTKDRYIRTGIGVEDIDYIVSDEWKPSLGYEMAMAGIFIPVKDSQDQLVFSEEDYKKIREQMRGLSYYDAEPFLTSPKAKSVDALFELYKSMGGSQEKIDTVQEVLSGEDDEITISKKKSTLNFIRGFFADKKIHVTNDLSSSLSTSTVELIDTGSTGRGTNVPGDGDFDFMLRHNLPEEILSKLQAHVFSLENENSYSVGDGFRVKNATLPDGQVADIDVTYAKKDLGLVYSSDMSIKDRLNSIKQNSPEDYNYVRANIIMAKNILKQMGIYKKRGSDGCTEHGGFGGIGVENWILQNGGSFATAIDSYLAATKDENGKDLTYSEFIERYPIFDFGNNHREGSSLHDRFSAFLGSKSDTDGHEKEFAFVKETFTHMQEQLHNFSKSQNQPKQAENDEKERELAARPSKIPTKPVGQEKEQEEPISPLRQSISVEGLREASRDGFKRFCKQNFALMAKLLAKYSKEERDATKNGPEESQRF